MKILWLDTETTGLSPWKQDVIQMAGIVEIDGKVMEKFEFKCQPHFWEDIQQQALDVHGYSEEDLAEFPKPAKVWNQFCRVLDTYVDKYDKTDKFIMAGYNVGFDFDFMKSWWSKCEQSYFGSYFEYKQFDVYPLVFLFDQKYNWQMPKHKLVNICEFLSIEIHAHDALADIEATKKVYDRLCGMLPDFVEYGQ